MCNNVNNVTTRGHPYKLLLQRFTTDCRKFFSSTRDFLRIWNNLPIDVDFTSVKSFVRAISRIILRFIVILMCDPIVSCSNVAYFLFITDLRKRYLNTLQFPASHAC